MPCITLIRIARRYRATQTNTKGFRQVPFFICNVAFNCVNPRDVLDIQDTGSLGKLVFQELHKNIRLYGH